jgi:hypothetical protein
LAVRFLSFERKMHVVNSDETIKVTKSLYRHPDVFEGYVAAAQNFPYSKVFSRLILWLDYFNESFHSKHCVHYHGTIEALFEIWFDTNILMEQTGHEFDLSKQFYDSFFETVSGAVFVDTTATKKMLVLSYVFSKYHGLMQCSLLHQFKQSETVIRSNFLNTIFKNTFVKYESPQYLISNFEEMTSEELELLMCSIIGQNKRSHPLFEGRLTKHEFARLNALESEQLLYKDRIFLRGAIIVSLTTENTFEESFVQVFLRASGTFVMNPEKYYSDIKFWKRAYELVYAGVRGPERCSITDCVDFLEYMKYQNEEPFTLKGRTVNSLMRLTAEWHGYVYNLDFSKFRKEVWEKSKSLDLHFTFNDKNYYCQELHSGELLYKEGKALNHCVITYTPQCINGICTIWSLKQWNEKTKSFISILTLEVADKKLIQARGNKDRLPTYAELKVLKDWTERMGYSIELLKNQ